MTDEFETLGVTAVLFGPVQIIDGRERDSQKMRFSEGKSNANAIPVKRHSAVCCRVVLLILLSATL